MLGAGRRNVRRWDGLQLCQYPALDPGGAVRLANPQLCQTEIFGNASLLVIADAVQQLAPIIELLEGNLTGCIYSDADGADHAIYEAIAPRLAAKSGVC